jgi:guanylate kinase
MSNKTGRLFVISASSGTGKTTLAKKLLEEDKNLIQSISYTTRKPRRDEIQGKDYFFVTKSEFFKMRKDEGFIEWANVFGKFYGTARKQVEEHTERGRDMLLLIDVQGAKKIKQTMPEAVFIFLAPPSKEELKRRLEKRGTESRAEISKRYRIATRELIELNDLMLCDYRIVNREIPVATGVLKSFICAERLS